MPVHHETTVMEASVDRYHPLSLGCRCYTRKKAERPSLAVCCGIGSYESADRKKNNNSDFLEFGLVLLECFFPFSDTENIHVVFADVADTILHLNLNLYAML